MDKCCWLLQTVCVFLIFCFIFWSVLIVALGSQKNVSVDCVSYIVQLISFHVLRSIFNIANGKELWVWTCVDPILHVNYYLIFSFKLCVLTITAVIFCVIHTRKFWQLEVHALYSIKLYFKLEAAINLRGKITYRLIFLVSGYIVQGCLSSFRLG